MSVSQQSQKNSKIWLKFARATARKINFGWWLQAFHLPLVLMALVIVGLVLLARYYDRLPGYGWTISAIAGALICCGLLAWLWIRRQFEDTEQSIVRIEDKLELKNALSSAMAGITPWPSELPKNETNLDLKWHLPRTVVPPVLALAAIIASFFIPIGSYADTIAQTPTPDALSDLETKLDLLDDQDIVQEDYIEEVEEKVEELKSQDPAEWFSHSSLEAIDSLRDNHNAAAKEMKNNLNSAERTLQNLQKHGDKMNQTKKENLLNEFGKAVENLDTGAMKPNKELLDQLKKMDPKQLDKLSPEQLDQLRKTMRETAEKLKQQGGDGGEGDGEDDNDGDGEDGEGDGEGEGNNPNGQPGKGGIQRGPGEAPQELGREMGKLKTGKHEKIKPKDLSDTLPGDLLETTDGEHDIDKTDAKIQAGGVSKNKGEGGERVWKNSLLPEEKKALKNFFK